ncbi:MYXO-CTERM sorting domain-containing protein [Hyalangium minutum]|uniref:Lipoprotein n=1 Tax=Hyalangium minutum TaxID=394096 RepID=A0A085WWM4_9BACT|nr:MYXO-CTERM sorting domain-containing protein [Hyalangium minutum]KFE72087.1 hypothetical protein DB31_0348 [Hyalangium minutum]
MSASRLVPLLTSLVALSLTGCGGDGGAAEELDSYKEAKLESGDDVKQWSGSASAVTIFFFSMTPMIAADLSQQGENAINCPEVITEGSKKTYKGGCTDKSGKTWFGTAVTESFNQETSTVGLIRYEGFGYGSPKTCGGGQTASSSLKVDGEIKGEGTQSTSKPTFDINFRMELGSVNEDDCTLKSNTMLIDYEGSFEPMGDGQKWNGKGRIGSASIGKVEVSTVDQVLDTEACLNESLSGSTTLKAGKNTVVVTYDGATDCDDDSTAHWSLNGQDQGKMAGIGCSAGGGGMGLAWGALAALLLLWPRRRCG